VKAWWRSKTLWVNLVAGAALLAQSQFGFIVDAEAQGAVLVVVNLVLRLITNEPVGLKDEAGPGPFPGLDAGGPGVAGS
jgi:uncharacterized membrane protein